MKTKTAKPKTIRTKKKKDVLGLIDVVFVIDSTGSMGSYILEAKQRAKDILKEIQTKGDLDIQVALVTYRDHPPQDYSYVTEVTNLTTIDKFDEVLAKVSAGGGGDRPEAVYDGIHELSKLSWRNNSDRIAYLIGDSPPHLQCICGITESQLIEELKVIQVELHAHSIAGYADTTASFERLVSPTGGKITTGNRPEDTTTLYTSTLNIKSKSVDTARTFIDSFESFYGTGSYVSADSITYDLASAAGASVGLTDSEVKDAVDYLKKRKL